MSLAFSVMPIFAVTPWKASVLKFPLINFLFLSQITMWDLQSGKLLRSITDAHPTGSAVLHVMVRKGDGGCSM